MTRQRTYPALSPTWDRSARRPVQTNKPLAVISSHPKPKAAPATAGSMANGKVGLTASSREVSSATNETKDNTKFNTAELPEIKGNRVDRTAMLLNKEHKSLLLKLLSLQHGQVLGRWPEGWRGSINVPGPHFSFMFPHRYPTIFDAAHISHPSMKICLVFGHGNLDTVDLV